MTIHSLDGLLFLFGTSLLFVSLGKFIPRYLIILVSMVNGINSLLSLSDFSLFPPSICHEMIGPDAMILVF